MIPAARAQKCAYHGLEYDATQSSRCPACKERDKREALAQRVAAIESLVGGNNAD